MSKEGMSKEGEAKKKIVHFYCFTCKDYELKTSPHYRAQKPRFARRRKTKEMHQLTTNETRTSPKPAHDKMPLARKAVASKLLPSA